MHRAILIAVLVSIPAAVAAAPNPVTVYLRRDGGTLTAGWDDSRSDVSSLASQGDDGEQVTVPAWRGGDRKWSRVGACVRERFARFAIDVVDRRPARGDYIMVMVGGRSDLLGYPEHVGGVSPYTGELVARGVSFVFSETLDHDVEGTCVSIVHEVGHALGLDHAYVCEDPMSYLYGCGKKTFQDVDAECGEAEPRPCANGNPTQNSYRHLAATVGLRDGADVSDPEPEPEPDPEPEPEPDPEPADSSAPSVSLSSGSINRDHVLTFTATASSPHGIADVALVWANPDTSTSLVIPCSDVPDDVPATCKRDGDRFTFRIRVGSGARAVAAAAIDRRGDHAVTDPRWLWLDD